MPDTHDRLIVDWSALHREYQTGPCFICEIVNRSPDYPAHIVYEDDLIIAFLDKYPVLVGYTLVCPKEHREHVTGDYTLAEYLAIQERVYRVAEALRQAVGAERVYLLTLGSQQGNAHVHWHIAPLPPGVSYREQQLYILKRDVLDIPEADQAALTARIRARLRAPTAQ